jgi:hypothetical protein
MNPPLSYRIFHRKIQTIIRRIIRRSLHTGAPKQESPNRSLYPSKPLLVRTSLWISELIHPCPIGYSIGKSKRLSEELSDGVSKQEPPSIQAAFGPDESVDIRPNESSPVVLPWPSISTSYHHYLPPPLHPTTTTSHRNNDFHPSSFRSSNMPRTSFQQRFLLELWDILEWASSLSTESISNGLQVSQIHCDGLQLRSLYVVVALFLLLLCQDIFHCHLCSRGTSTCQVNCRLPWRPIVDQFTGIEMPAEKYVPTYHRSCLLVHTWHT